MDETKKAHRSITGWFSGLVSVFDALDVLVLGVLLVLLGVATLAGPVFLARDLLADALVIPAVVVVAASVACVVALAVAWIHRGLRWWYFALLLLVAAVITEAGCRYIAV